MSTRQHNTMSNYSREELTDMHFCYGLADGRDREAQRLYAERYPNRRCPSRTIFSRIHRRLRDHGVLEYRSRERSSTDGSANSDERILDLVQRNPFLSTRRIATMLQVPQTRVWRVLHTENLHPYHFTPVQELTSNDKLLRAEFCRSLLLRDETERNYFARIFWTDEAQFTRDGVTNFHNLHQWSSTNPHNKKQNKSQHRFSCNVWLGIVGQTVIGPRFLNSVINGESYLQFLRDLLPDLLDNVPLAIADNLIYQQDGAPAHYSLAVRNWLDDHFGDRWIGRRGPTEWPPRSPDLTPLDFYAWGFMKNYVYEVEIGSLEQLKERIEVAAVKLQENLSSINLCAAIRRRYNLCLLQNGDHIENFL